LKGRPIWLPTLNENLLDFSNLYLPQKIKDQGFPSSENRNWGSKLSLLPTDRSNITAGFPSEKVGTNEIPLLVTVTAPPK